MIPAKIPQLGSLEVECWLNEEHTRELEVTENPIEFGSPIVDHAFVKAQELVVEFGVSNLPIGLITDQFGGRGTDRIQRAREMLFAMQDQRQMLTVQTITGGLYRDMLLKRISWRSDKKSVHAVKFALTLKEVKITQTETTQYTPIPVEPRTAKQTQAPVKRGEKPATALPSANGQGNSGGNSGNSSQQQAKAQAASKQEAANQAARGSILSSILN